MQKVGGASGQESAPTDPRRQRLLEAALATFLRHGFRKTSMDLVAGAAQISRQGLYLHFASKELLFVAALQYALQGGLGSATARLHSSAPLGERLVSAIDAWAGPYIGVLAEEVSDLHSASASLGGPLVGEYEAAFVAELAKALKTPRVRALCDTWGIRPLELAQTLNATVHGLKTLATSRADFVKRVKLAVQLMLGSAAGFQAPARAR